MRAADAAALSPLTDEPGSRRLPGKFVWADLVTDDVPAARNFYAGLFGWTFRDLEGSTIAANHGRSLCGMIHKARPADRPDARPRWVGYVSVPSIMRARLAVNASGGRVLAAPDNFPGRGRQAVFADAEGAVFGIIKSTSGDPADFLAEPGDWIWAQLLSRDARKASDFYRSVGRYEVIENTAANRLSDYLLASKGHARATIRTIPRANARVQPAWLFFVRVENVRASVARATRLGGETLIRPSSGLLDGKVAVIADPTGAAIGLLEWEALAMKGVR